MISVCFRFDDPSATSDHDLEKNIINIFSNFKFFLTVAVIPYRKSKSGKITKISKENISHLIEAEQSGILDIALHGHSHLPRSSSINGSSSEFSGLPVDQQHHLIKDADALVSFVFGQKIRGFVPPWNCYDQNTANVLNELSYEYISAGERNFKSGKLAAVPRTCTMRNALGVIKESLQYEEFSPVVIVVLHPDEFEEFSFPPDPGDAPPFTNLESLKEMLNYINEHSDIELTSIKHIAKSLSIGNALWTPHQLKLPYRVKALFPSTMLFNASRFKVFFGMLKKRLAMVSKKPANNAT